MAEEITADALLLALLQGALNPPPFAKPGAEITGVQWRPATPGNGQIRDCLMVTWTTEGRR
jgi:hypothetical protein